MKNIGLTDLELKKTQYGYFLEATYEEETDTETREIKIHDIELPIHWYGGLVISSTYGAKAIPDYHVDLGFGPLKFKNASETVKPKIKEVTMDDIEKKFGCKIKIVK